MAVQYAAVTQNHTATSGLPGNVFTLTMWLWPASQPARYMFPLWLDASGGSSFVAIGIRDGLNNLQLIDSGNYTFNGVNPLAVSAQTWYKCAAVVDGANATFYRSAGDSALVSGGVADFAPPATPSNLYVGNSRFDEWYDGRLAALKVWDAALTQAEIEAELAQYLPHRTANLLRFHPFLQAETADYSGNGNALSGGTGATTADGPPIPWAGIQPRLILPAATGGTQTVAVNRATETDTSQAIARAKAKASGQAAETDTARPIAHAKTRVVGLASETDSSGVLTRPGILNRALETSTARALASAKAKGTTAATETDTARTVVPISTYNLLRAAEVDAARALGFVQGSTIAQCAEADSARPIVASGGATIEEPEELTLASATQDLSLASTTVGLTLSVTTI